MLRRTIALSTCSSPAAMPTNSPVVPGRRRRLGAVGAPTLRRRCSPRGVASRSRQPRARRRSRQAPGRRRAQRRRVPPRSLRRARRPQAVRLAQPARLRVRRPLLPRAQPPSPQRPRPLDPRRRSRDPRRRRQGRRRPARRRRVPRLRPQRRSARPSSPRPPRLRSRRWRLSRHQLSRRPAPLTSLHRTTTSVKTILVSTPRGDSATTRLPRTPARRQRPRQRNRQARRVPPEWLLLV